ncbi:hypothetical protein CJP74_05490 [Psittacicella melopsittaci]|uniref:ATP-binding cassette transporter n=1 Tax=Psittacicella melopsittaci TaxID=2028576 RepID=A0A3A1Y3S5_9GAMM|nr:ABC transporter ATP-binding protein/permease [Psittacicella melopsittaci]RIY32101.1 hypothetical protein CJP74_05490 [Psittacicella melopsittaci]
MQTLKYFFALASYFWYGKRAWRPWLVFAITLLTSITIVQISVYVAWWNKDFYDALANLEKDKIWGLVGQYFIYMGIIVFCVVLGSFLRKKLMFWWREDLTKLLQNKWLKDHKHYRLSLYAPHIDNPDQRIAEDVMLLCTYTIDLVRGLCMNIFRLVSFVSILWTMSAVYTLTLGQTSWQISGYLVWVAFLYSLLCSLIMHAVGYKLQRLNVDQQHYEANYRGQLIRLQESSEAIALYQGEAGELKRLEQDFGKIKSNWRALIWRELKVEVFSATSLRITLFIPLLATLPMYLGGQITFGSMMQARSAFANVQDGFNWFVDSYKTIIKWAAVVQRLGTFVDALEAQPEQEKTLVTTKELSNTRESTNTKESTSASEAPVLLEVKNLDLFTQEQRPLLAQVQLSFVAGQWYQLQGPSGLGKTTLLRALAGIWPYYQGQSQIYSARRLFLPQKPYLFKASLREVLSYPYEHLLEKEQALALLQEVGLAHLSDKLEQVANWHKVLSGGEQQRLSLARALHLQPQVLFLDEATNQLDSQSAQALFALLAQRLPQTMVVGITHQPELNAYFKQKVDLTQFKVNAQEL